MESHLERSSWDLYREAGRRSGRPLDRLKIGDPRTVADKVLSVSEALGRIERLSFQMSIASLPHAKRMHAIELLGAKVAPSVRNHSSVIPAAEIGD